MDPEFSTFPIYFYDYNEIETFCLAKREQLVEARVGMILGVLRGGGIPALMLSQMLGVPVDFIRSAVDNLPPKMPRATARVIWLGSAPSHGQPETDKGISAKQKLMFHTRSQVLPVTLRTLEAAWLLKWLPRLRPVGKAVTIAVLESDFEGEGLGDFGMFWFSKPMSKLRGSDLLVL